MGSTYWPQSRSHSYTGNLYITRLCCIVVFSGRSIITRALVCAHTRVKQTNIQTYIERLSFLLFQAMPHRNTNHSPWISIKSIGFIIRRCETRAHNHSLFRIVNRTVFSYGDVHLWHVENERPGLGDKLPLGLAQELEEPRADGGGDAHDDALAHPLHRVPLCWSSKEGASECCLLYTSDAADD